MVVIIGLGQTGLSCARYCTRQNIPFAITDSRLNPSALAEFRAEFPEVNAKLGAFDAEMILNAEQLIVSPGVSLDEPILQKAREQGIEIVGDVELFCRAVKAPIIAITGSNGKTTVTTLVGLMLQAVGLQVIVCGNIGEPVLQQLMQPTPDFYVLELSSFQLETTYSLNAHAATVLNISADHMDRYPDLISYITSKQRIFQNCQRPVVNLDDTLSTSGLNFSVEPVTFSVSHDQQANFHLAQNNQGEYIAQEQTPLLSVTEMPLKGMHHYQNALAALALCSTTSNDVRKMASVLRSFAGLPHRCQWVREIDGVSWYNDSKGTNVGASIAAITSLGVELQGQIILIAGGDAKAADLHPLCEPVSRFVKRIILIGRDAPLFKAAFTDIISIDEVGSLYEAVLQAKQYAEAGDAVLLSPACASFDMFNNYMHRGDVFVEAVNQL